MGATALDLHYMYVCMYIYIYIYIYILEPEKYEYYSSGLPVKNLPYWQTPNPLIVKAPMSALESLVFCTPYVYARKARSVRGS